MEGDGSGDGMVWRRMDVTAADGSAKGASLATLLAFAFFIVRAAVGHRHGPGIYDSHGRGVQGMASASLARSTQYEAQSRAQQSLDATNVSTCTVQ